MSDALAAGIEALARQALGSTFRLDDLHTVQGGDISTALRARSGDSSVFIKLRPAADLAMFEREADGLRALAACTELRVPTVLQVATLGAQAILMLEWLDILPLRDAIHAERAGAALATLHRRPQTRFGWAQDNFIGSTPQPNAWSEHWAPFFAHQRLQPQLALAARNGHAGALQADGERVCAGLAAFFLDYAPAPSLLHGDLWSSNIGVLADGSPVVFDPACYCGDREADLAMTELFGGFPLRFYAAYREAWPLDAGYEMRKPLYNLYHVLNHLNLFGRAYLGQAQRMLRTLCDSLRG